MAKKRGEDCPNGRLGGAADGMPDWHSAAWFGWSARLLRKALRDEHRRFEYHRGDPPVNFWVHSFIPQETPGLAPSGYVPMWEDEVLLYYLQFCLRYGIPPLADALSGDRFVLFPRQDSHFWVVDYVYVRNELDCSWGCFRAYWPLDRIRRCVALVFTLYKGAFRDVPGRGEWEDLDVEDPVRGFFGVGDLGLACDPEVFYHCRRSDGRRLDFSEEPRNPPCRATPPSYFARMIQFLVQTGQLPTESRLLEETEWSDELPTLMVALMEYGRRAGRGGGEHYAAWRRARLAERDRERDGASW